MRSVELADIFRTDYKEERTLEFWEANGLVMGYFGCSFGQMNLVFELILGRTDGAIFEPKYNSRGIYN